MRRITELSISDAGRSRFGELPGTLADLTAEGLAEAPEFARVGTAVVNRATVLQADRA